MKRYYFLHEKYHFFQSYETHFLKQSRRRKKVQIVPKQKMY